MKSIPRTQHLTDAEFSDLLAGELPDQPTRLHLAACDYCRTELDSVRESLSSFSLVGTRWAEAAAPARVPVPSRWALGLVPRPNWATGLAATAFTGLLVFFYSAPAHHAGPAAGTGAVAVAAPAPSNAELAEDNRLMVSIDQELGYQTQSTIAGSGVHRVSAQSAAPVLN